MGFEQHIFLGSKIISAVSLPLVPNPGVTMSVTNNVKKNYIAQNRAFLWPFFTRL